MVAKKKVVNIKEFHLFAGIGGGIYGGELLGHQCCAGVEISEFCQKVLKQRQKDGWMNPFEIYGDLRTLNGENFKDSFDVLCGGFPCQAFSTAAHGKNIAEKNLWNEMLRFVKESNAPVVFGENVVLKAILKAKQDLEQIGYKVQFCRLSCSNLGADHQRNRFWLLAVKNQNVFSKIKNHVIRLPKFKGIFWSKNPDELGTDVSVADRREQLKGIGNAQSPFVAATAFRILVNRHTQNKTYTENVSEKEISQVFVKTKTWIKTVFGEEMGLVHTPTTMANYSAPSMMKHQGCRNFKTVFYRPTPKNAEYLMGFPLGASSPEPQTKENFKKWGV